MSIIVSNCQHCDEQQFQTLSCYSIFSVVKLDLFIRAQLLDRILALEKTTRTSRVHLVLFYRHNTAETIVNYTVIVMRTVLSLTVAYLGFHFGGG